MTDEQRAPVNLRLLESSRVVKQWQSSDWVVQVDTECDQQYIIGLLEKPDYFREQYDRNPISNTQLLEMRIQVLELWNAAKTGKDAAATFDTAMLKNIHGIFDFDPVQASQKEVWGYLASRLLPDVVQWRWSRESWTEEAIHDRISGRQVFDRHTFGRLWWQRKRLGPECVNLIAEARDQIATRPYSLLSRPEVSAAIAELVASRKISSTTQVVKDLSQRLTRIFSAVPADALSEAEMNDVIERELNRILSS